MFAITGLVPSIFVSIVSEQINMSKPIIAGIPNAALRVHVRPTGIESAFAVTPPRARKTQERAAKS
jgi:hypothetical protein